MSDHIVDRTAYEDTIPASNQGKLALGDVVEPATLKERLNQLFSLSARLDERIREDVANTGLRIFPIKAENDFTSVETDYGAPAIGMDFFRDLMHSTRSFRYERVHVVEGDWRTHVSQSTDIGKGLKGSGFKIFDPLDEEQYPSHIYFANGGVTRAFSDLIDLIIDSYNNVQKEKEIFGKQHAGAILVPVPTYGLFLYHLANVLEGQNIKIIPIPRDEKGAVRQSQLIQTLKDCRHDNIRPLAYYDCNPQNPTGYIRERAETESIAKILMDEGQRYIEEDIAFIEEKGFDAGIKMWTGATISPYGKIVLIDDMAYEGLEHSTLKKPFSFGQVSEEVAEQTAVLKGVSKIGLPGRVSV